MSRVVLTEYDLTRKYDEHASYGMSRTCPECAHPGLPAAGPTDPGGPMGPCIGCGLPALSAPRRRPAPAPATDPALRARLTSDDWKRPARERAA